MEATGVYWKPVWHILSDGEFELVLANAAHVKNVPGRKTDVNDATWLADLMAHGLIRPSFVPDEPTQQMRDLLRTRKQFVRERTGHTQRIQKTLEDANIKLDSVISDIVGISGRRMIEALIAGRTAPQALAALADGRLKATPAELEASLRGRVTAHHRFMLRLHLDQLDALDGAIGRIDKEVDSNVEPFRVAIEMLKTIPGVSRLSAEVIVSEIGIDRSRFPRRSDFLGRTLPQERRKRWKTPLHAHEKGCPLAQDYSGPMRMGGHAHQANLPPRSIPAHSIPPRRQEGHRCCRRFHPHGRLPHAQKWHPLRGPRRKPLRQTRPRQARLATREPLKEPRFRRPDHAHGGLINALFLVSATEDTVVMIPGAVQRQPTVSLMEDSHNFVNGPTPYCQKSI